MDARRSCLKPRNRRCADIVAASNRAQRFTVLVAPLDRLALLVRREFGLAPEFHALSFRVRASAFRALFNPASFELRRNAKDGKKGSSENLPEILR